MIISLSCASAGLDTAKGICVSCSAVFPCSCVSSFFSCFCYLILLVRVVVGGVSLVVGCSLLLFLFFFLLIVLVLFSSSFLLIVVCVCPCHCLFACFFLLFFC